MPRDNRRSHGPGNQSQEVMISKALSRLLRHAAVQERIPIDSHGYVRMDHLMNWQRLKSMQPRPTMLDIIRVVRENEKQRFGMKHQPKPNEQAEEERVADVNGEEAVAEDVKASETQKAITIFENGQDTELKHYFIRANQGHSMQGVEAENLLSPITLDDETSVPQTVVHGTFYGAWEKILRDGGLKSMSRNHVHFSTGPPLEEAIQQKEGTKNAGLLKKLLEQNKVVSGMRPDAQILIYVDMRKALQGGMKWWRSENGVVLTEGVDGLIGTQYWEAAVEAKEGLGLLWKKEGGVVKELPQHLKGRAMPMGKRGGRAGGARGGGGGGKPKTEMERCESGDL